MGLLIGVGNTRPTYPYDYYYGIEWDSTVTNPACTRVGKVELHQALPLQSLIRRCILKDDGTVNYYLDANDSTKRDTGITANLDGTDGQVMVELPDVYIRFEKDGTKSRCLMSMYALPGFQKWGKNYISAYEATVQRSTLKLASVKNLTVDYRGGNNDATLDGKFNDQNGKPATNISLTNFRIYARNRGSVSWNCNTYQMQKKMWWMFAVEYANFNSQATFNAALTTEGYRQGGLGDGVTTIDGTIWSNFNGSYPFIACGITNSLGNKTNVVSYTMPFEYDANGSANYKGEYNAATAYVVGNYVSSGTALYRCILNSTGNAVTNTTYFTSVTRKVVSIPSYRGIENPFGHIWKWTDGCKCMIQSDAGGGISQFYVADLQINFSSAGTTGYQLRGNLPRIQGYVKELILGEYGEIMPLSVGGGSTTYFCDNFYTTIPASGTEERGVLFGGAATNSTYAGFVCATTTNTASFALATIGSRLCFIP